MENDPIRRQIRSGREKTNNVAKKKPQQKLTSGARVGAFGFRTANKTFLGAAVGDFQPRKTQLTATCLRKIRDLVTSAGLWVSGFR
jgi:hypothetical protein